MLKRWGLVLCMIFPTAVFAGSNTFIALCYHNVVDEWDDNPMTLPTKSLVEQLSWLKSQGYNMISLQQIIDASSGRGQLPEKSVLLTFDDGYANFYHRIYPILQMFEAPAVFALVTEWLETPKGQSVQQFGDNTKPRDEFVTWAQVREMVDSGLIEIASHTNNLHHGVLGNPQGNSQPSAITRGYDVKTKSYETDRAFRTRISNDLKRSSDILHRRLGIRPRALVWPYGAYNQEVVEIAKRHGFSTTLTLLDGENRMSDLPKIRRYLLEGNPPLRDFAYGLTHLHESDPIRVTRVELDRIYDPDPSKTDENLSRLLDRINEMNINTVYLQAFADLDANGIADMAYFPNRHLPVRSDLFNRVAWQLETRTGVSVYAWLPVYAFETLAPNKGGVGHPNDRPRNGMNNRQQLVPDDPDTHGIIAEIYTDLAKHTHFDGLFFGNDILANHTNAKGKHGTVAIALNQPSGKSSNFIDFTTFLADRVRYYRTDIKTVLSVSANLLFNPKGASGHSDRLPKLMRYYDYVAVMTSPFIETAEASANRLDALIDRLSAIPGILKRTVIELPTMDRKTGQFADAQHLRNRMNHLQKRAALHFGYFPDDFHGNNPPLAMLKSTMSLQIFPYGP